MAPLDSHPDTDILNNGYASHHDIKKLVKCMIHFVANEAALIGIAVFIVLLPDTIKLGCRLGYKVKSYLLSG